MNPEELKAYKREKSRLFNANLRELRLKDKARQGNLQGNNNQPGNQQGNNQGNNQGSKQDDNQDDGLTLEDLMDIYETLDTKLDLIESKLETIMENKLYEPLDKLETKQPQPSIFFA